MTSSDSISGSGGKRFLNDPTPCLHFCNYIPFEESLALYPRIIYAKID
jgi:hypothetical protein